jgi:hypothetical protein
MILYHLPPEPQNGIEILLQPKNVVETTTFAVGGG